MTIALGKSHFNVTEAMDEKFNPLCDVHLLPKSSVQAILILVIYCLFRPDLSASIIVPMKN